MPGRAGRNRTRDPFYYWNNTASMKPEAQALATRLGLDIPVNTIYGYKSGLIYPIRRLIITAEDTPENYALLLGPLWNAKAMDIIKKTRIEGSPRRAPREPTKEEEVELRKIGEMQEILAKQMGEKQKVENKNIKEMCTKMGNDWASNLGTLMQVVNGRNQGVGGSVKE
ncbi:MAG: hypothetical protein Q9167_005751 [Letrouitia subvulpina]